MKTVIYYSNFNLDSCLAAMMRVSVSKTIKDNDIEVIAYDRTISFQPPKDADSISIVGVEISPLHIEALLDKNPTANIDLFDVSGFIAVSKYSIEIVNRIKFVNSAFDEDTGQQLFKELSPLMYHHLFSKIDDNPVANFNEVFPNASEVYFRELMGSLIRYNQFEMMTKEEIYYVHKNIENIMDVLEHDASFTLDRIESVAGARAYETIYTKHINAVRTLINRNFAIKYLTSGINYLHVPVLNIAHDTALAAIRLISYSYDDVVTYEDNAGDRIYRIHTSRNREWYIKCMKPNDVWMDGHITVMRCPVPIQESK